MTQAAAEATVVSVCPFKIEETKPGLVPGNFIIPEVKDPVNDFEILHIGISNYTVYVGAPHFTFTIPELGQRIAESIVRDYIVATFFADFGDAQPGLFSLPGKLTKDQIKKDHADKLTKARALQKEWFIRLCLEGDNTYEKFKTHNVITKFQRIAAEQLGHEAPWIPKFMRK
jgi:hypothetical protein